MSTFDFIVKNADAIAGLDVDDEGVIVLPFDDFDFSYKDLSVEVDDEFGILFKAEVPPFTLSTSITPDELKNAIAYLANISDPDSRRTILEEIDKNFRQEAETDVEMSKENMEDAKRQLQEANDVLNNISKSVRDLKSAWSIP